MIRLVAFFLMISVPAFAGIGSLVWEEPECREGGVVVDPCPTSMLDHYIVMRSVDGAGWEEVGAVPGDASPLGTSVQIDIGHTYHYIVQAVGPDGSKSVWSPISAQAVSRETPAPPDVILSPSMPTVTLTIGIDQ